MFKNIYYLLFKIIKPIYLLIPIRFKNILKSKFPSPQKSALSILPLRVPTVVHIDPSNICNFKCVFCPTGDSALLENVHRPKGTMSLNLFTKIIDYFSVFTNDEKQKIETLLLFKDGEPFLNKDFIEMIEYAVKSGVAKSVEITTNAALLSSKYIDIDRLICSGISEIRISVEAMDNVQYFSLTGIENGFDTVYKNVVTLRERINALNSDMKLFIKIIGDNIENSEIEKFNKLFTPLASRINIDTLMGWSMSDMKDFTLGLADNNLSMDGIRSRKLRVVCPEPFSKMAVNFNGEVSVCCVDWSMSTIIGDLNINSAKDVWTSKEYNDFRINHLIGKRSFNRACKDCEFIHGLHEFNDIDRCASRLVELYQK